MTLRRLILGALSMIVFVVAGLASATEVRVGITQELPMKQIDGSNSDMPVPPANNWTSSKASKLGANLISSATSDFDDTTGPELVSLSQSGISGFVAATTLSDALEYFPDLEGWEKALLCNSHNCLQSRVANSAGAGLHYDFLGYGPERLGGVPEEEKTNLPWATQVARQIADDSGKGLLISYSTKQLHLEALERGFGWDRADQVIDLLAPFGDRWMIQAADEFNNPNDPTYGSYGPILSQRHFPPGPEWRAEVEKWTNWIRAANPDIEIWIQIALHRIGIPGENYPSAELAMQYREWLVNPQYGPALVDGVYISSTYSWPIDSIAADQEMKNVFLEIHGQGSDPTPIFADVPFDHPYHQEIEALYLAGFTAGCRTEPLMFCPDSYMTRAESAVFMERAIHGSDFIPPDSTEPVFWDVPMDEWYAKWVMALWRDGYTAGCNLTPLNFCPLVFHTRTEGAVFALRILHGTDYYPPDPVGIFDDVPVEYWGAKWIEVAYTRGLIPACGEQPLEFCPNDLLSRGLGAYMIVQALDLLTGTPPPNPTPTPSPPLSMNLIEEGNVEGYHYWLYENPRYACGAGDGNHEFLVLQKNTLTDSRNLMVKFPGGGVGFYYENDVGSRVYYPHSNAIGLTLWRYNRNTIFRVALKDGLAKKIRDRHDFRLLVPSYCSHDLYYGTGQFNPVDGFQRWGYQAAMEAVDFVQHEFPTNEIITYGGSAGASGAFIIGINQQNVSGIVMDSQASDLSGIRDTCLDGISLFGPASPCYCPQGSNTTCMEVLGPRIGFSLGGDEPYHLVNRGDVRTPIFYIWNENDGSRFAYRQFQNLHDAIEITNPGGNSVTRKVCIDDPNSPGGGSCNLHVPTAYDYLETTLLVDEVYEWILSLIE